MGFFRTNNIDFPDFSALGTDLHSHILPGMDDGASTITESLRIINEMARLGYRKLITTPHVISTLYPNTKDQILGQGFHLQEFLEDERQKAEGKGQIEELGIRVEVSGEYHMDGELLDLVQSGEVLPFGKENYLLIELPWNRPSFSYEEVFREIQLLGYVPVVAHPERIPWMMGNMKMYQRLIDLDLVFQLNLNSLNGLYGFASKMAAHQLIDAGMIGFAGSDVHYTGHVTELQKVLQSRHFAKLMRSGTLLNSQL